MEGGKGNKEVGKTYERRGWQEGKRWETEGRGCREKERTE